MSKRDILLIAVLTVLIALVVFAVLVPEPANQAMIRVRDAADRTPLIAAIQVTRGRRPIITGGAGTYIIHWFGWFPAEVTITAQGFHEQSLSVRTGELSVDLIPLR